MRVEVDETGSDDQAGGVDAIGAVELVGADRFDAIAADPDVHHRIGSGFGVEHTTAFDHEIV